RNSKLREQSVEVLRDLLASHDSDIRYTNFRSRISSIYLPLLSIVMDNYHRLYKGADGWENLTNTFDRNTEVRRSVVIKEGSDGSLEIDDEESRYDQILGPASTRNLLICFLWVLKNIDPMLIKHWWSTLSISRLNLFLNVLDLCVACFEYKGKRNLMNQLSGASVATSKNSNNMKDQLANAILSGVGTAKERLQRRRQQSQDPAAGGSLRWGKTVWQAAAEYTEKLLKHCSSSMADVRAWACASLYLLMRQNYEIGQNFARVKVQVTVALSSIVAGSTKSFNEHHLRRSLKTLILYAEGDDDMYQTSFPEQVKELAINLHRILLDTVKMKSFQNDHEMLMDLMYRISKGYQTSPDLRLTWLQNMAKQHNEKDHYTESAMCLTHAAALVAEYLYMLDGSQHLPVGCVTFQKISPNMLEESAISDDVINPDEEGIATSRLFTESGLIGLLEQAAPMFRESQLYEAAAEIYKLVIPLYEHRRKNHSLESVYNKLSDCYKSLAKKGDRRFLGSYFRVGFYGFWFGDLHMKEFIYKEEALMKLSEFSLKLENLYSEQLGSEKVEIIKDSNEVDTSKLDGGKAYIQVTYVEPYFEDWELKKRLTVFDKSFNIRRFSFSTPFTPGGKAHGELHNQWMKRTVLTTEKSFPYVKRRLEVIRTDTVKLKPLEVAILNMESKIHELKAVLNRTPCDSKLLQMQLQGGIATAVNQGPFAIAKCFLEDVPLPEQGYLHHKLKVCFKEFTKRCQEALERNEELIGEEQYDYQRELVKNFKNFQSQLQPMVSTQKKMSHSKKAR
ncbi:PREDICTED: dedicator of cytokinesis protein 7-like, partial [Amphimedon queenslandica]|uniref:DOCKER domain-containing protein n=1 Tax=Amphimedon queenslandica TaxID=400682 RepID=A0AAN0IJ53_AMPQE